jgi:hypothetical protein
MRKKLPLTQTRARELLDYNPTTGVMTWRVRRGPNKAGAVAGYIHPSGYRFIEIDGRATSVHRVAWLLMTGKLPKELDHINLDKDDNRFANLRIVNRKQNCLNRPLRADNDLGVKGVRREGSGYRARITHNGRLISIGTFATIKDASRAYREAASKLHGEFAYAS